MTFITAPFSNQNLLVSNHIKGLRMGRFLITSSSVGAWSRDFQVLNKA